jgi:hypothetical protein
MLTQANAVYESEPVSKQGARFINRLGLGLKNVRRCNGNGIEKKNGRNAGKQPIQG